MSQSTDFVFSFSFHGSVWNTAMDEKGEVLLLEVRDKEEMILSFYRLHLRSFQLSQSFTIPEADWWTTLLTMVGDLVFLEKYPDPQDPSKKQLIIFHQKERKTIHLLDDRQLAGFTSSGIKTRRLSDPEREEDLVLGDNFEHTTPSVLYPVHYAESTKAFETIKEYLEDKDPVMGCEYLEVDDCIIISYYLRLSNKFVRYLVIIRNEHELVHEVQDEEMNGFASGSFFVVKSLVVFIKNGNTICGVKI